MAVVRGLVVYLFSIIGGRALYVLRCRCALRDATFLSYFSDFVPVKKTKTNGFIYLSSDDLHVLYM